MISQHHLIKNKTSAIHTTLMLMTLLVISRNFLHLLLNILSQTYNLIQCRLGQIADTLLRRLHIRFHSLHQFLHLLVGLFQTRLEFVFQFFGFGGGIRTSGLLELSCGLAKFIRNLSDYIVDVALMGFYLKIGKRIVKSLLF